MRIEWKIINRPYYDFLQAGTQFGNAIEYKSNIEPETMKTTISVENLQPGANYKIQFSVLMYEG